MALRVSLAAWLLWLVLLGSLAAAAAAAAKAAAHTDTAQHNSTRNAVRFFIDEGYFLEGDTEILRAYITASQGRLEISGESSGAFMSIRGYYVPEKWDVYWTIRSACHKAYESMKPGQMVNCIPGVQAMSLKRNFLQTWQQAYGEAAFGYIPRSYLLPQQYWLWRSHLLASGSPDDAKWVLKANIHRGKGVSVVPQHQALSQALMHTREPDSSSSSSSSGGDSAEDGISYHNILVQQYLEPQMVIAGRSSYLRLWLLVTTVTPLRAYLFRGGFAIFGKQKGSSNVTAAGAAASTSSANSSSSSSSSSSGSTTDDLIVNLWIQDREKSPIWSLQQLEQYLEKHPELVLPLPAEQQQQQQQQRRTFADAWSDMQHSASLVLAAVLPAMRAAAANVSAPRQGTFEYFGLDFVLDAHLRPWLLEVNAIPSMSRRKKGSCVGDKATADCQLNSAQAAGNSSGSSSSSSGKAAAAAAADDFDEQKEHFVHDMLVLLGLPVDAPVTAAAAAAGRQAGRKAAAVDGLALLRMSAAAAAAAANRTGSSRGSSSSGARKLLQQWLDSGRAGSHVQRSLLQVVEPDRSIRRHRHHRRDAAGNDKTASLRKPGKPTPAAAAAAAGSGGASQQQPAPGKEQQGRGVQQLQQQQVSGVLGLQDWSGPVPQLSELPAPVRAVLCSIGSSSSSEAEQAFACISCLTADDLAALAAAEAELQRAGRFAPVYDVTAAYSLSSRSAGPLPPDPADAADAATGGSSSGAADTTAGSSAAAAAAVSGTEYLRQERSVWQKLYHTWLALSTSGVGLRDLGLMKYYTTASKIAAGRQLKLGRQDYVLSAWLKVRQQLLQEAAECKPGPGAAGSGGSAGKQQVLSASCVAKMLQQLVSHCYIQ
uniref:Tubulin--tyrosine ligase-like protein 5 n=1 Tax=Tetradesmus obliquus TaxID=3088 RepID=A0A383WF20_TETOB|eukprot:jgi/Sobl393_1/5792/SZX75336.1